MKDTFGNEVNIGNTIVFNPPYNKGLIKGTVIGFSKNNCPHVINAAGNYRVSITIEKNGFYSVKSHYAVINSNN